MNKPTDYPVGTEQSHTTTKSTGIDITYAELKSRVEAKQLITDEMIRNARAKLDTAHVKPTEPTQVKFKLSSIRDRFRAE